MIFLLSEVKELSTAEVAVTLKITEQRAKTRLHRAKALLSSRLGDKLIPFRLPAVTAPQA